MCILPTYILLSQSVCLPQYFQGVNISGDFFPDNSDLPKVASANGVFHIKILDADPKFPDFRNRL